METPQNPAHLTGKEGEEFDLELSAKWTKNHRDKHPDQPHSHFFGKEILERLLSQPNCMGIRMYNAYDDNGTKHLILVGVTKEGHELIPKHQLPGGGKLSLSKGEHQEEATGEDTEHYGIVAQVAMPCPGSANCP